MNPEPEIRRLIDLMPASGRMLTTVVSKPEQPNVIEAQFPLPWQRSRPISINFDLWSQLPRPQRDLLLLRTVSWLTAIKWFKPNLYQGMVAIGLIGTVVELVQGDAMGVVAAGGLTAIAGSQIWRNSRSSQLELEADATALRVAQRRGYTEPEAAQHLLAAIENVARIENRAALDFNELIRCQNLRAIAGLSVVGAPDSIKKS